MICVGFVDGVSVAFLLLFMGKEATPWVPVAPAKEVGGFAAAPTSLEVLGIPLERVPVAPPKLEGFVSE